MNCCIFIVKQKLWQQLILLQHILQHLRVF
jgi:hypothetical protein